MTWPLQADEDDDVCLLPPWDGDIDIGDPQTETALRSLRHGQPALAIRICRKAFLRAEAQGDKRAALQALFFTCATLYNSSQPELGDRVFEAVRARAAAGIGDPELCIRIELVFAKHLSEQGQHAQAATICQRSLESALALGDVRVIVFTLACAASLANEAGEFELALSLCEQQEPLLRYDDPAIADMRSHHADNMAQAWMKKAAGRGADLVVTELQQALKFALSSCALAKYDRERLHSLRAIVHILLRLDCAVEAQAQIDRCTARLLTPPTVDSVMSHLLELVRAEVEIHCGCISVSTLAALRRISTLSVQGASDLRGVIEAALRLLLQAEEQLGHYEHALRTHKRATEQQAQLRSAHLRQRLKTLCRTVLAMRAEAVEFVTHDLLTPLAAAQTWLQPMLREGLPSSLLSPLCLAHKLLAAATSVSDQYLGFLRAELMPQFNLKSLDFGALTDGVCESFAPTVSSNVRLMRVIDIGIPVMGDVTLLKKMLAALLADAFNSAPAGTRVELSLTHDSVKGEAALSIRHDGVGPAMAIRMGLHQRLFGDEAFGAVPPGLALAARVCRLHRMRLRFARLQMRGSEVRLTMKTKANALVGVTGVSMAELGADVLLTES